MKTKIVVFILVIVLAVSGCGTKPVSNQNTDSQVSMEAKAQADAEEQKAKEIAYSEAIRSGTKEVLAGMNQMSSILENYNPSKIQDLANSIVDISMKVEKVALIDPPPGYEHVQILYKQGSKSLMTSMVTFIDGLDKNDSSLVSEALYEQEKAGQALKQAIDEMNAILASHGLGIS